MHISFVYNIFFCFPVKQIEPVALFLDQSGRREKDPASNTAKLNQQTVPSIKRKPKRAKEIKIYPAIRQQENNEQQLPASGTPYVSKIFHSQSLPLEVPGLITSDLANQTVSTNNFITTTPKRPQSSDVDEPISLKRKYNIL